MSPRPDLYSGMIAELEKYTKPGRQTTVLKGKIFADHKLLPMTCILYEDSDIKKGDIVQFELDKKKQPINIRRLF